MSDVIIESATALVTVVVDDDAAILRTVTLNGDVSLLATASAFPGPTGPPGATGPAGAPAFVFTQSVPAATWMINHNLGYNPTVTLLSVGGMEFESTVVHTSVNQTVISLSTAVAGSARLT